MKPLKTKKVRELRPADPEEPNYQDRSTIKYCGLFFLGVYPTLHPPI